MSPESRVSGPESRALGTENPGLGTQDPRAGRVTDAEAIELVLRYQAGEPAALEALYARLRPAVLALLRPYRTAALPGTLAPQDVTQQSWVVLAELASRWRPQGSFLAYFFRSFPRRMRRYVRQAGSSRTTRAVKLVSLPHDELVGQVDRALAEPAADAALGWLEPLGELPPEQRVAVALRILEERDFASIGRVLHVSRATAHRLYRQALKQLAADV